MMMHHNTKFGNKCLVVSLEDITWTNIDILTLHCDLDHEFNNPLFFQKPLLFMMLSLVAKESTVQKI